MKAGRVDACAVGTRRESTWSVGEKREDMRSRIEVVDPEDPDVCAADAFRCQFGIARSALPAMGGRYKGLLVRAARENDIPWFVANLERCLYERLCGFGCVDDRDAIGEVIHYPELVGPCRECHRLESHDDIAHMREAGLAHGEYLDAVVGGVRCEEQIVLG